MKSSLILSLALVILFLAGCSKKVEPVPVGEMGEYRDPGYGFKVQYPKIWVNLGTTGKAIFTQSQDVLNKFLDPTTGIEGAQVTVEAIDFAGKTPDAIIQGAKDDLKQMAQLGPDTQVTVAGKTCVRFPYTIKATTKTNIYGYMTFVPGDTVMFRIECEGYGDQYAAHQDIFNAVVNSFALPVYQAKTSEAWVPSGNLETYTSPFFTFKYPDNLNIVPVKKGANDDFAMEIQAPYRMDCSFHIDVFGAKNLDVQKVWAQNKARYRAKSEKNITIDGQPAVVADYSPRSDISSQVYLIVKNDKVIRLTINYFAPQKSTYYPMFEGMAKSLSLK